MIQDLKLGVIGLGKLGSPMAAVFAKHGLNVIGCDLNPDMVADLKAGKAPVDETDLQAYFDAATGTIEATTDVASVGRDADVIFVIVPTPSQEDHTFTNKYVISALKDIGRGIREADGDRNVIITSTVMPGSTGGVIRQALEEASGRTLGDTLGLCYNPEFIALGSVIRDMEHPDFLLIGESAPKWGQQLEDIHRHYCLNKPEYKRMSFVNAEITKIAVNTYTTTKITYANMLSELCEKLPGADVDVVSDAVGTDSRVGKKYLKGGVGYGGTCFPRDNKAFAAVATSVGANAQLAITTDEVNDYQLDRIMATVKRLTPEGGSVGIVGLAYKDNTAVTEQSQGWQLAARCADSDFATLCYDSHVPSAPEKVQVADGLEQLFQSVDTAVLMLPYQRLMERVASILEGRNAPLGLIDPWRIAREAISSEKLIYVPMGLGLGR